MFSKDGHSTKGQYVVDADRTEKGTFSSHVCSCDNVEMSVLNLKIIFNSICSEKRMVKPLGLIDHFFVYTYLSGKFRLYSFWFVVAEGSHRYKCVKMAYG